jgi:hypothetical protein
MSYKVYNKTPTVIVLTIKKVDGMAPMKGMNTYHRRDKLKGKTFNFNLPPYKTVDLTAGTGLTKEDCIYSADLQSMVSRGYLVVSKEPEKVVQEPIAVPEPVVVPVEEVEEVEEVPEPVEKVEEVKEPKKPAKKDTKKAKRK